MTSRDSKAEFRAEVSVLHTRVADTLRIDAILGIPKISHPPGIWTSLRPAQYELGWSMKELGMEEDGTKLNLYQEKDFHQPNGHEEHVGFGFERGQFEMVETKYFQPMK